jgi:hypothetical protein
VQSNAEHEQHHANLGDLPRDFDIAQETGGGRADEDTGQQLPHQRRELDPRSEDAQHESEPKSRSNGRNQGNAMRHRLFSLFFKLLEKLLSRAALAGTVFLALISISRRTFGSCSSK